MPSTINLRLIGIWCRVFHRSGMVDRRIDREPAPGAAVSTGLERRNKAIAPYCSDGLPTPTKGFVARKYAKWGAKKRPRMSPRASGAFCSSPLGLYLSGPVAANVAIRTRHPLAVVIHARRRCRGSATERAAIGCRVKQDGHRRGRRALGWVERSETHHRCARRGDGFSFLYPSYAAGTGLAR